MGNVLLSEWYDGFVEETTIGGSPNIAGYVKGNSVYEILMGGEPRIIGSVEDGNAYEFVAGGPKKLIGKVRLYNNKD